MQPPSRLIPRGALLAAASTFQQHPEDFFSQHGRSTGFQRWIHFERKRDRDEGSLLGMSYWGVEELDLDGWKTSVILLQMFAGLGKW